MPHRDGNSIPPVTLRYQTDGGVTKDKVFAQIENRTRGPRLRTLSTKLSLHPSQYLHPMYAVYGSFTQEVL